MANLMKDVLEMDAAMKARDAPKQGMQNIVNPDGTTTNIPYTEDRYGRRTVMTSTGPKVLRGHEGKRRSQLGTGLGNLLGGILTLGQTPPYVPQEEEIDYFDMSSLGPKSKTTTEPYLLDSGETIYQEKTTDPAGNVTTRFLALDGSVLADPRDAQQAGIATESVRQQEMADPSFVGPRRPANLGELRAAKERAQRSKEMFGGKPKELTLQEKKLEAFFPAGVSISGKAGTRQPTQDEMQSALTAMAKATSTPPKMEPDYDAALFLPEKEREKYTSGTLSQSEFNKLHNKAMTALSKNKRENPKKTEGVMKSETAYTQMMLAVPNLTKYENDPEFVKRIAGTSGALSRNIRMIADDDERMYLQAADAWIRAKLRKESGAAIGEKEMEQEYATFFPQLNDSPETIAEKARQRQALTRQMGISAGVLKGDDVDLNVTDIVIIED